MKRACLTFPGEVHTRFFFFLHLILALSACRKEKKEGRKEETGKKGKVGEKGKKYRKERKKGKGDIKAGKTTDLSSECNFYNYRCSLAIGTCRRLLGS